MYNVIISPLVYNVIIRGGSYGDHAIFSAFNVYIYMYVYICIDIYIYVFTSRESLRQVGRAQGEVRKPKCQRRHY
jgi:hypothetical protein